MNDKIDFESAIKKIEEINSKLEKGMLSLDEMTELYSQGTKLVAVCNEKLNEAQLKITKITEENNTNGEF